jgi:translation initiation factor eIF-2B subunit beta
MLPNILVSHRVITVIGCVLILWGLNVASSIDGFDANGAIYPPHFYSKRDDLRQSVMEAIQEMMSELEDLHKNINEQATQHIHAGEIILTYALSKTVELVS